MAKVQFPFIDRKGKNRVLSVNDNVTRIEFTNKGIAKIDLSPIRRCLRLRQFHMYGNEISDLDISPLSGCTLLRNLVLRDNKLVGLDLTGLSEHIDLQRIDLRKNHLQSLNVDPLANHLKLEKFTLEENPLLVLDISALITCRGLKEVSLSRHTKLKADRRLMAAIRGPLRRYKKRIIWIDRQAAQSMAHTHQAAVAATVSSKSKSPVLGVLKSVPRISMEKLSEYSEMSVDDTRDLVFVLVGQGEVEGRYDPDTDDFISLSAVQTAKSLRSDGPRIQKCQHCGSPLARVLTTGERFTCQSCGMVNEG
ncbi:MAG: hypothetical protein KAQ65_02595 [Candidatus Thorarchaeota archaeon]|nr:hypothetical protein [Candidatus Thorarchaeota archaeon]